MVLIKKLYEAAKSLVRANWMANVYFSSFAEVAFTLLVSNFAILIGVFVFQLTQERTQSFTEVFFTVINKNIKPTEILVFILGLIAPAIWIMVTEFRSWRHAKFFFLFLCIQAIVVGSTGIIFTLSLTGALKNLELTESWAHFCLLLALCVWFATLVYKKKVIDLLGDRVNERKPGADSGASVLATLEGKR